MKKRITIFLTIILTNCIQVTAQQVVVLDESYEQDIAGAEIGIIKYKDKGFKFNCTYDEGIKFLKNKALEKGANLVKIIEHKTPDAWSTCHRFEALLYNVEDAGVYEKEIYWSKDRKLNWSDFKNNTPPHGYVANALTMCGISFQFQARTGLLGGYKCVVKTIFYTEKSWVSNDSISKQVEVLNHEQKHFDLCEVYARKIYKEITEAKISAYNTEEANRIFQKLYAEYEDRQYQYDEETQQSTNNEAQEKWNRIISEELTLLDEYANHS